MKMLMDIDPLSMRGSMLMTMTMIPPSQRDVSPAEQLRQSPRLVLPKFRLETAAFRPESFLLIFSGKKEHHVAEDGIRDGRRSVTGVQTCALPIWSISINSFTSTISSQTLVHLLYLIFVSKPHIGTCGLLVVFITPCI